MKNSCVFYYTYLIYYVFKICTDFQRFCAAFPTCGMTLRRGLRTPQTLHEWVKKAEVDSGQRAGVPTEMADKLKALERENRELRQANEILRKASAYFATAELDRRSKP